MANSDVIVPFILKWEGGYCDIKGDRGGATNKGVTLRVFQSVYGQSKTKDDLKRITDAQWSYIFKKLYWDKCKCSDIKDQSVANMLVDYAWMSGVSRAIKDIQSITGATADGIAGSKTIAAINAVKPDILFEKLRSKRLLFYNNIVKSNPSQYKFLKGWTNRVNALVYGAPYWKR